MNVSRPVAVMLVVLVLLQSSAAVAVVGPSHQATSGVTYETNSGLEVSLASDRDIPAVPFAGSNTFAPGEGVEITAPGTASASITDGTFADGQMQVLNIDASNVPVRIERDDLASAATVRDGQASVILHDVALDDGNTDLTVGATTDTNITIDNVPTGGIQAIDAEGNAVAGETETADGQVTLDLDAGSYELRLVDGPSTLEVRDIVNQTLVDEGPNGSAIEVEVQFFGSGGAVERRTTTTGEIDMTGLPADERFSVSVDAGGEFVQRQIIIPSLLEQQTAYLLPQDVEIDTVEPRFIIQDPSNQFDTERSEIILKRPIETDSGTEFVAVAGDRVGLNGFDTILERDQRYRVTVRDPDSGAVRELGAFTPTQSEQVTLTVQDVEFDSVSQVDGVDWTARYNAVEDASDTIEFIYRDIPIDENDVQTNSLTYEIHERGNTSNVLTSGSASGNVTISEPVPPDQSDTVWVVSFSAARTDGNTITATRPVSTSRLPVGPGLAGEWQVVVSMLTLFVVAGLFGAANPGIGGIAVAGTGGFLFFLGWLPDSTGGIMVALALFVAVLAYVGRKARGATA